MSKSILDFVFNSKQWVYHLLPFLQCPATAGSWMNESVEEKRWRRVEPVLSTISRMHLDCSGSCPRCDLMHKVRLLYTSHRVSLFRHHDVELSRRGVGHPIVYVFRLMLVQMRCKGVPCVRTLDQFYCSGSLRQPKGLRVPNLYPIDLAELHTTCIVCDNLLHRLPCLCREGAYQAQTRLDHNRAGSSCAHVSSRK